MRMGGPSGGCSPPALHKRAGTEQILTLAGCGRWSPACRPACRPACSPACGPAVRLAPPDGMLPGGRGGHVPGQVVAAPGPPRPPLPGLRGVPPGLRGVCVCVCVSRSEGCPPPPAAGRGGGAVSGGGGEGPAGVPGREPAGWVGSGSGRGPPRAAGGAGEGPLSQGWAERRVPWVPPPPPGSPPPRPGGGAAASLPAAGSQRRAEPCRAIPGWAGLCRAVPDHTETILSRAGSYRAGLGHTEPCRNVASRARPYRAVVNRTELW